jgi:hypothetical protein
MLAELRETRATTTAFIARVAGRAVNSVLEVATRTFSAEGLLSLRFGAPCGAIEIANWSTHPVTVASGATSSNIPPLTGVGVYVVPAGTVRLVNIAAREVTLYGTAADTISYQAFAGGGLAETGLVGPSGGAA